MDARAEIDARNRRVLEFLADHRVVIAPQVASLLGVSNATADARLRALDARGYITRQRIFEGYPASCQITRKGLGAIGSTLPLPNLDLRAYPHDVGVGWIRLAAGAGLLGDLRAIHSEREMRSEDRRSDRDERPFGVGLGGLVRGRPDVHYPDLLLETTGGKRIAIELELTGKNRRRLEKVMLGYAVDRRIDAVLYLVPDVRLGGRVRQAARSLQMSDRVHVQLLAGDAAGAPPHARTLSRMRMKEASRGAGAQR